MLEQPIPRVTDEDVKRIVLRDFGEAQSSLVFSILDEFGQQPWNAGLGLPRVRLAILKLANGEIDRLRLETKTAIEDCRDVLAPAEYPRWTSEIGFDKVPISLQSDVVNYDWKQYCEWLGRQPS